MKTVAAMLALTLLTLTLTLANAHVPTNQASTNQAAKDKAQCAKVKDQIRAIEAKMRNGYTAAQGIRYEERLKRLKDKRYKVCR